MSADTTGEPRRAPAAATGLPPKGKPGPAKKIAAGTKQMAQAAQAAASPMRVGPLSATHVQGMTLTEGMVLAIPDATIPGRIERRYLIERDVDTGDLWAVELTANPDPPEPVPGPVDLNERPPIPMPLDQFLDDRLRGEVLRFVEPQMCHGDPVKAAQCVRDLVELLREQARERARESA